MDADSPRLRLSILGIVVFGLFATLFARLYYLQVMAPGDGQVEAANNRIRVIQEEAPRGRLLDAKGRVLVDNRTSLVVTMEPQELIAGLAVMLPAMNIDDRTELLGGIKASAPAEAFAGVWSLAGSVLTAADHQAVAQRLGLG